MPQLVSGLYGLAHRVVDRGRQALSTEAVDGDLEHSNAGRLLLERGRKTVGLGFRKLVEPSTPKLILDGRIPHVLLLEVFTDEGIGTMVQ